jgi:hypothetical protein
MALMHLIILIAHFVNCHVSRLFENYENRKQLYQGLIWSLHQLNRIKEP